MAVQLACDADMKSRHFNFSFETYDPFKASTIESLSNLEEFKIITLHVPCLLYTSPSPRD